MNFKIIKFNSFTLIYDTLIISFFKKILEFILIYGVKYRFIVFFF